MIDRRAAAKLESRRRERLLALLRGHGYGWERADVPAPDQNFVDEFLAQLWPEAGQDAYEIGVLGHPSVYIPLGHVSANMRDYEALRRRAQERDSRGPARLLVLGDSWSSYGAAFVCINGEWSAGAPVRETGATSFGWGGHAGGGCDEYERQSIMGTMVDYLTTGTFYKKN